MIFGHILGSKSSIFGVILGAPLFWSFLGVGLSFLGRSQDLSGILHIFGISGVLKMVKSGCDFPSLFGHFWPDFGGFFGILPFFGLFWRSKIGVWISSLFWSFLVLKKSRILTGIRDEFFEHFFLSFFGVIFLSFFGGQILSFFGSFFGQKSCFFGSKLSDFSL